MGWPVSSNLNCYAPPSGPLKLPTLLLILICHCQNFLRLWSPDPGIFRYLLIMALTLVTLEIWLLNFALPHAFTSHHPDSSHSH